METAAWVVEKEFGGQLLAAPILSSGQYVPGKQVKHDVRGLIPFPYFPLPLPLLCLGSGFMRFLNHFRMSCNDFFTLVTIVL